MKKRRKGLSLQIITVCRAVKIREQQLDPCSALGSWHRAGTPHPVSLQSTNPSQQLGIPCGQHKVFFELQGFFQGCCAPVQPPGPAAGSHSRAVPGIGSPVRGEVGVLPCECQELFLGKPWLLPSGMGGKEPLT